MDLFENWFWFCRPIDDLGRRVVIPFPFRLWILCFLYSEYQLLAQSLSVLCGITTIGLSVFSVVIWALLWIHFRFCWITFTRTQVKCVRLLKKLAESCRRWLCCHLSSSSVLVFSELILWGMKWYYVGFYFLSWWLALKSAFLLLYSWSRGCTWKSRHTETGSTGVLLTVFSQLASLKRAGTQVTTPRRQGSCSRPIRFLE